jgi:uncharacterized protein (DUF1800 family)
MRFNRPLASVVSPLLCAALAAPLPAMERTAKDNEEARAVHVLNRLGYGPRPGDVERVRQMGVEKWIEMQMSPERISDPEPEKALADLSTIHMSPKQLSDAYELPRDVKAKLQKKRAEMEGASEQEMREARREFMKENNVQMAGPQREVVVELQAAKLLRAIHSERQLDEVLVDFWLNHFNVYAEKGPVKYMVTDYEQKVIRPHAWGKFEDLLLATAQSPAMLFYLDNYLSVAPNASMEREGGQNMRRNRRPGGGFGRPGNRRPGGPGDTTMMGEGGDEMRPRVQPQAQQRRRGLNENYAREIMELHTLGVDGGYTQKDVTELARCLTGWTIRDPRGQRGNEPEFLFDERRHDDGDKVVLGKTVKSNGRQEGLDMIHMLATHPSTARFISYKLARRFVADEPPKELVDRAAEVFKKTDGNIREVVKTIVTSKEFFAPENREAKTKTPLEFVVSAVRASGASTDAKMITGKERRGGGRNGADNRPKLLGDYLASMGMPLYLQQPPTGYKDTRDAWESTGGLLTRLNFAFDLAGGRIPGLRLDAQKLAPRAADADSYIDDAAEVLLPNGVGESTRSVVHRESSGLDAPKIAGLLIGSPEFQRR